MADPRKLFESRDMEGAILYAKRITGDNEAWPVLVGSDGALIVSITSGNLAVTIDTAGLATSVGQTTHTTLLTEISAAVRGQLTIGTVSLDTTAVTISNAVGNPVNVSLTSTVVSVTFPPSLSTTDVTINNLVGNPVRVALTSTEVTVKSAVAGFNVNISTATLGTVVTSFSSTLVTAQLSPAASVVTVHISPSGSLATVSLSSTRVTATIIAGQTAVAADVGATGATVLRVVQANGAGRTLTGSTGSLTATNGVITLTPSNRVKVYAFSLTTTSATEVTCIFHSGSVANGLELWRCTLMAPAGANSGANLTVTPPAFLFQSRSGTSVSLSLSSAVLVHYSVSYFDEA